MNHYKVSIMSHNILFYNNCQYIIMYCVTCGTILLSGSFEYLFNYLVRGLMYANIFLYIHSFIPIHFHCFVSTPYNNSDSHTNY